MSDNFWSQQGEDADFDWEDWIMEPTSEPTMGFEGATHCSATPLHPMIVPPPEESVLVVKPGLLQGHLSQPGQPTSGLLLYERSPARALDQTQASPDQTLYQWATASEPPQPQAAREVPSSTFGSAAFERDFVCNWPGCEKRYVYPDYLVRHMRTVHHNPSRYLCHFRRCPRSIKGRGFGRKDKLVDHLKSRKHDLSHEEALYEAAKHNVDQAHWNWDGGS